MMRPGIPCQAVLALFAGGTVSCSAIEPVTKGIEKVETARAAERARKPATPTVHRDRASPLQARPSTLDFRNVPIGADDQRTVMITSPFSFAVTVLNVLVEGDRFGLTNASAGPRVIPPYGQLAVAVTFHPTAKERSSGQLIVELDTAGGRFTRVSLSGAGR